MRIAAVFGATSLLLLTGCAAAGSPDRDDRVDVVASTDVYGQIAEEIGGRDVTVTSLITSASQDPHSYEASARDQLTISRADLIVANGGGYDPFIDALIEASGTRAGVITAVDFSPAWSDDGAEHETSDAEDEDHHAHAEGVNEHVWYDPATMAAVADAIADDLAALDPAGADAFGTNADEFRSQIGELTTALDAMAADSAGTKIFVTEPVPLYLTDAAGLDNITPDAFSEAVEEGQDVPPATLIESLNLVDSGDVRAVIVNAQTGGAETARIIEAAELNGIPVLEFAETLPDGFTYVEWMQRNIDDLIAALAP